MLLYEKMLLTSSCIPSYLNKIVGKLLTCVVSLYRLQPVDIYLPFIAYMHYF